MLEQITTILNKSKAELFKVQYPNLNEIPIEVVEHLRLLPHRVLQIAYIREIIATNDLHLSFIANFLADIVDKNIHPKDWSRGGILVPSWSLKDMLALPREKLLQGIPKDFSLRIVPNYDAWIQNCSVGGPAYLDKERSYLDTSPKHIMNYSINDKLIEPIGKMPPSVVIRRWIAQLIARFLDFYQVLNSLPDITKLTALTPFENWSEDAKKALQGLLKEKENNLWKKGLIPGILGNDEWYL